jgi:uncharacterized membrane protein
MTYYSNRLLRKRALAVIPAFGILVFLSLVFVGSASGSEGASNEALGDGPFQWFPFLAPFHSVVLHLPIGFVIMAAILDVYSMRYPGSEIRRAISVVLICCALSAVLAITLGLVRAMGGGYEEVALNSHKWWGIAVGVLTIVALIAHRVAFRDGEELSGKAKVVYRLIMAGNIVILMIAGHLGGNLTHGSKYLVANAPEFVKNMLGEEEGEELSAGETVAGKSDSGDLSEAEKLFVDRIKPIFVAKCERCHGEEKQKGDYTLVDAEIAVKGGESELAAIVPGQPMKSFLVELITMHEDEDEVMPPSGKEPLTPEEIGLIIRWIIDGAPFVGAGKSKAPEQQ